MARPHRPDHIERKIHIFANEELEIVVNNFKEATKSPASSLDVLGALVWAARELPHGIVGELVNIYEIEAQRRISGRALNDHAEGEWDGTGSA